MRVTKKFKVHICAVEVMANALQDSDEMLLVAFLKTCTTINSERYVQTLKKLKATNSKL